MMYDNSPKPMGNLVYGQPGVVTYSTDPSLGSTSANFGDIHLGEESSSDAYEYDGNSNDGSHARPEQVKLSGPIAFAGDSDAERIPISKEGRGAFQTKTSVLFFVMFQFVYDLINSVLFS